MRRSSICLLGSILLWWSCSTACGGGDGGGNGGGTPSPPPPASNPCTAASSEAGEPGPPDRFPEGAFDVGSEKRGRLDSSTRWNVLDAIWDHRAAVARGGLASLSAQPITEDIGDIAVVQDEGDLILPPNTFDLSAVGLRFTKNGADGYNVARIDAAFRQQIGNQVTLGDDDTRQTAIGFPFSFYRGSHTQLFINSDGNLTFEQGDDQSTERNIARLLTGPPRVAPFLADLDPSAGGRVHVRSASDGFTATWCGVRGFDTARTTTVQVTLLPDSSIEMKFGDAIALTDAVVGVSPGRTGVFMPVDLSATGPTTGGRDAVGERFAQSGQLDLVSTARKFLRTHPDVYDQLVIWTDTPLLRDAFAFEVTVKNEIRGIGQDIFDLTSDFGSSGTLRSLVNMDALGKYPNDPQEKFLGENNTVSVLGQECGHRWLAFIKFRDHTGATSEALLGRDNAHWSFFFDSDASVMEGNDIEDLGGAAFRTTAAVQRYSLLDQYVMGLVEESQVPAFFYVGDPVNVSPPKVAASGPAVGVRIEGTRRDVLLNDVIAVNGPRDPPASQSPRVHRQAFLYVVSPGSTAAPGEVEKVDSIRRSWETFFLQATGGRMRAITALR
jgi:hypothetical protein